MDAKVKPNVGDDVGDVEKRKYVCHLCKAVCSSKERYVSHMKTVHGKVVDVGE